MRQKAPGSTSQSVTSRCGSNSLRSAASAGSHTVTQTSVPLDPTSESRLLVYAVRDLRWLSDEDGLLLLQVQIIAFIVHLLLRLE